MAATDVTRGSVRADGNGSSVGRVARRLATETKQAFKTTEFWAMVGLVVAILVSAAVINGGDNGTDEFIARQAWLYVSILGAGYFISRGLAKSGSREPYTDDSASPATARTLAAELWLPAGAGGSSFCPRLGRNRFRQHPNWSDFVSKQQEQKIVQYLNEAHGSELALVRQLQAQIAMTPRGSYRDGLETHLQETRRHAERLEDRLARAGSGQQPATGRTGRPREPCRAGFGADQDPARSGSGKRWRGEGAQERQGLLRRRGAGDRHLHRAGPARTHAGDAKTERLAKSMLGDEQRMLDRLLKEIPRLTDAVARAEFDGEGSYDVTETGAADTLREVGGTAKRTARQGAGQAKRTARQARKVPGVARAEGTVKGAVASESDLAISNYDSLSADEVQDKLSELSQIDLAKVNAYERKNQNRSTVTSRIDSLQGDEPWPGYDELSVEEVRAVLSEGDDSRIKAVRGYERKHKARAGVIQATERELSNA